MTDYISPILFQYKSKGVVIDSNLLLLYFIGSFSIELISNYKKTKIYSKEDYDIINILIDYFNKIITTPNILTEISNLSNQLKEHIKQSFYENMKSKFIILEEIYYPSLQASEWKYFNKYGLTDSVIFKIGSQNYLIITDDFPLSNLLEKLQIPVINFNHIRTFSYSLFK